MALKQPTIDKLKGFGFDVDKLIAAIKAEAEQDYEIPEVTLLTPTQLTERDNVKIADGKKLGEAEAKSTLVKELGKRLNTDFKGERLADVVNEIQAFTNKNGDEKVKLLQDQVTALTTDKTTLSSKLTEFESNLQAAKFDSELIGFFPTNRGAGLTDSERLTLLKSAITFETVDGKPVAKRNGQVVTDPTTHAPLPVKNVIESYFTEKPLLLGTVQAPGTGGSGGRGGGDNPPGGRGTAGIKKFSEAEKAWKEQNPTGNTMSSEFTAFVDKLAKTDPEFNYYE
jgi:hypothetical protein